MHLTPILSWDALCLSIFVLVFLYSSTNDCGMDHVYEANENNFEEVLFWMFKPYFKWSYFSIQEQSWVFQNAT